MSCDEVKVSDVISKREIDESDASIADIAIALAKAYGGMEELNVDGATKRMAKREFLYRIERAFHDLYIGWKKEINDTVGKEEKDIF